MSQTVLFCHCCNEKFAVSESDPACPHCGQTLLGLSEAPTADLSDVRDRGTCLVGIDSHEERSDKLLGRRLHTYQIEAFLGKGGMAKVYRGLHLTLERPCAIKVLNPTLVRRNPDFVKMFFAEARTAASLVHPHVVTIHTIAHDDGLHLIEMEYVAGRSLQSVLEFERRLDVTRATGFLVQISSALAVAHGRGMVHRDIKPGNVLVTDNGVAKLADFGLAKRVVGLKAPSGNEPLVGTPYFMAPELFRGQQADSRSDVYALGITYYCLLAGAYPITASNVVDLAEKHADAPLPDISQVRSDIPPEATAVLHKAMSKDPRDRYADAAEMHAELKGVFGSLRTLESLVRDALDGTHAIWHGGGERFTVWVPLPCGRSQTVYIQTCQGATIAEQVVEIYSPCGPVREDFLRRALELNGRVPHGSIAIEKCQGVDYFVMGNAYPRATCDPEEVRQSVLMIARHADALELSLTGGDRH
jgi:serine/threonine-protein kinase